MYLAVGTHLGVVLLGSAQNLNTDIGANAVSHLMLYLVLIMLWIIADDYRKQTVLT